MGGILHFFEFNQAGTSRKLLTNKRHADGLEAPRNSLELPIETLSHQVVQNNIPYSYQVRQHSSKMNFYPSGTPMKKLIDDEMSKSDSKRNAPSVVARLMGMDMLPADVKPTVLAEARGNESMRNNIQTPEKVDNPSTRFSPSGSNSVRTTKQHILPQCSRRDPDKSSHSLKVGRLRPREHPQEEQLQKFKKEFEAWQASKVWEFSRSVELGDNPRSWRDNQILALEKLNKEKMARHADSKKLAFYEKPIEFADHASPCTINTSTGHIGGLPHSQPNQKEAMSVGKKTNNSSNYEQITRMNYNEKFTQTLPKRIVILKPGPQRSSDTEDSWPGSSEITEEEGSIEDFLEEVKERLRCEIQGKVRKDAAVVRGGGNETPFHERQTDPKDIARHIAEQVRESVTRDLGMNLLRSESTRSYRSQFQFNGPDSPEFINKDTRKFLSGRLRNVLKNETGVDVPPVINRSSITSVLNNETDQLGPTAYVSKARKIVGHRENIKNRPATKTGSFRHEQMNDALFNSRDVSPRNLIRSMSAPVSGTSFGKLLLEEPRILTGAHIRRKHEATEIHALEVRKTRKERFSFRGKVSNLKHSLTLRGKLFGKKVQTIEELRPKMSDSTNAFMTAPSVLMNLGIVQENSTEVPPSPASVCSSACDEFSRPGDHPSPVSTLDVPFIEDHSVPQVFSEISSNLHELRRQLNQLHFEGSKEAAVEVDPLEPNVDDLEGQAQAYIREVLLVSGLYDWSSQPTYPVESWVFERVEEAHRKRGKDNEVAIKDDSWESKVPHEVLFDLLNEALSTIVARPVTGPRVMRRTNRHFLHGKRLLDDVWKMIHVYVYPPVDGCNSLDAMVVHDLKMAQGTALMDGEVEVLGKEMEWMILEELIEEALRDLCC